MNTTTWYETDLDTDWESVMISSSSRWYTEHCKITEEDGDPGTAGREIWRRNYGCWASGTWTKTELDAVEWSVTMLLIDCEWQSTDGHMMFHSSNCVTWSTDAVKVSHVNMTLSRRHWYTWDAACTVYIVYLSERCVRSYVCCPPCWLMTSSY